MARDLSDVGKSIVVAMGVTLGVGLSILYPFVAIPLTRRLPYMQTPAKCRRQGLRALTALLKYPADRKAFVDLGSGDGEMVFAAVRDAHFAKAVGIELNWGLVVFSWIQTWRHGLGRRVQFYYADLWSVNLRNFDAIMMFGVQPLMRPLAQKVIRECRPGTILMLRRFKLPKDALSASPVEECGKGLMKMPDTSLTLHPIKTEGEFSFYVLR